MTLLPAVLPAWPAVLLCICGMTEGGVVHNCHKKPLLILLPREGYNHGHRDLGLEKHMFQSLLFIKKGERKYVYCTMGRKCGLMD